MEYSTRIYQVYLKYIAPEDIVVYSIDEVFMDVTDYLNTYKLSAHDLAMKIILDVLETTGITATAGIGTNLSSARWQWTLWRSTSPPTRTASALRSWMRRSSGVSFGLISPLTDFWRVGRGIAKKT